MIYNSDAKTLLPLISLTAVSCLLVVQQPIWTLTLTASSINCKGTLLAWNSSGPAYNEVAGEFSYILTNIQQVNTLLQNIVDKEDSASFIQPNSRTRGWIGY